MTKKIINDIVIPNKSIRQIPISSRKNNSSNHLPRDTESDNLDTKKTYSHKRRGRKPINPKIAIWFLAVISLLALFFGVSVIFSSAKVIITPKVEKIIFDNDIYTAKLDTVNNINNLTFEVLTVKQKSEEIVEATKETDVSRKASGVIVIYNNYSSASQRLINNTRFEANNGKIYRINNSVIVPGLKKVNGETIPGSVEAVVYADQAGADYNLKLSELVGDFKIPGFKGDVRYNNFYALLKTDITGGFVGKQRIVADDVRGQTEKVIESKLKEKLLKELYNIKPDNYLIFGDSYSIDYTILDDVLIDTNKVQINIEGSLNAVVFNNLKLANYIATNKGIDFSDLPIEFIVTDNFDVAFAGADDNLWKNDKLELKFKGEAIIKWLYEAETIKKELAGKKESELQSLLSKYKNSVTSIQVIFKPVWTRYFPDNYNKIKIEELI